MLELHKHKIPELEKAIAILIRASRRTALELVALIVENLGARAAGTCVAHGPKIIRSRDTDDLGVGKPGDLLPQLVGFIVVVINGDEKPVLLQAEFARDQCPGELDGKRFEIIAERKIPQHFKKSVVACRIADIVQIIVLAARAHAFLGGRGARIGALFHAGKDILELHHSGIGEHERRVIVRHEGGGSHDLVSILLEEIEKGRPDLTHTVHFVISLASVCPRP